VCWIYNAPILTPCRITKQKPATACKAKRQNLLMKLPAELRNVIYNSVLVTDELNTIRPRKWRSTTKKAKLGTPDRRKEPALLQVSREIRNEASMVHYQNNSFKLSVDLDQVKKACAWLKGIAQRCGSHPFKHFDFSITKMAWDELHYLLPFANLLHQTSFTPPKIPTNDDPYDLMQNPSYILRLESSATNVSEAMVGAVDLGRKARAEGWDSQWLGVEFGRWLERTSKSKPARAALYRARSRTKTAEERYEWCKRRQESIRQREADRNAQRLGRIAMLSAARRRCGSWQIGQRRGKREGERQEIEQSESEKDKAYENDED